MIRAALLLLCACNQLYGLDGTRLLDAAPPRVYTCPAPGPAAFAPNLHEIATETGRRLNDYSISKTGRATAYTISSSFEGILEGPVDGLLTPTAIEGSKFVQYSEPRLSPDGQRLYVRISAGQTDRIQRWLRDGTGWTADPTVFPFPQGQLSTIAADAAGDRMLFLDGNGILQDYVGIDTLRPVGTPTTPGALGVDSAYNPNLSTDGLRLVFVAMQITGETRMRYAERPDVDAPFGTAVMLPGVPVGGGTTFVTDDCKRVYVSGLERVFYVEQL